MEPNQPPPTQGGIPFTITLSNFGSGHVTVRTDTQTWNVTVSCPEGQAAVGLNCRDTLCPENFVSRDGKCFSQPLTNGNQFTNSSGSGSGFFLNCPTELVALNRTEFTLLTEELCYVEIGVDNVGIACSRRVGQGLWVLVRTRAALISKEACIKLRKWNHFK